VKVAVRKYNGGLAILYCLNAVIAGAAILVGVDLLRTMWEDEFSFAGDSFCSVDGSVDVGSV
jgi:hypothetical protein